jgi:N-acetylglucosamine-6-phosphate deacetylase
MLYIKNAAIYAPERLADGTAVLCDNGHVAAVGPAGSVPCPDGANVIDAAGLSLVPGFIEMQLNGAFGDDFTASPETMWRVAERLPRYGVTSFLPTVITSPMGQVTKAQQVLRDGRPAGFRGAEPIGLHLEGPFLNPQKKGAHNPAHFQAPTRDAVADWSPATGVRLVTMAPEVPGALEVIRTLAGRGVLVSAGHSMATFEQATAGFDAGMRYGTHLFNAMPALAHRDPGLPGALLTDDRVTVGFIADGVHTHPSVIKLVWQALGPSRLNLVTDAMAALGMPPGRHRLGDYDVFVDATSCHLADGTRAGTVLAGSILAMDDAVRNVIRHAGCSLADVLPTVTATPAAALGIADLRGRIRKGFVADLVLLSADLQVRATIADGAVVYRAG